VANGERSVVRRASVNGSNDRIEIKILPSEMDAKGTGAEKNAHCEGIFDEYK